MTGSQGNSPIAFRLDILDEKLVLFGMHQTPRGTKYLSGRVEIDTAGMDKAERTKAITEAFKELSPNQADVE